MPPSEFHDKSITPQADQLAAALGRACANWDSLVARLASEHAPLSEIWKFGGQKWGWTLQLKRRKRTVLYLTPRKGHFVVGFALGEKAVKAAHESDLPPSVLTIIDTAQKYAEGRAVRLEVRSKKDVVAAQKLAAIKMAN